MKKLAHNISQIGVSFLVFLVRFYQYGLKLFLPKGACIFTPTCSTYMILSLKKYGIIRGLKKGLVRISKCHSGNLGGLDYP